MNEVVKLENCGLKTNENELDDRLEKIEIGNNLGARESTYRFMHQQLRIVMCLVPFFAAFFITIIPLFGPAIMGMAVYQLNESKLIKQTREIFISSLLGVFAHCLLFYLPGWPIEVFTVVSVLNILFYGSGFFWKIIFK